MPELAVQIIGWVAAAGTTIATIPQAVEVLKTRNTSGISLLMYILFVIGVGFWIVYGFLRNDPVVYVANIVTFVFSAITLCCKIYNIKRHGEPAFVNFKKEK